MSPLSGFGIDLDNHFYNPDTPSGLQYWFYHKFSGYGLMRE